MASRSFNGSSDFISVADSSTLRPASLSISIWFQFNTVPTSTRQTITCKSTNAAPWNGLPTWWISVPSSSELDMFLSDGSGLFRERGTKSPAYVAGNWYWAGLTYTTTGGGVANWFSFPPFVEANFTLGAPTSLGYGAQPVLIGCDFEASPEAAFFNGQIAQFGIWNTALGLQEMTALAVSGARPCDIRPQNLIGYWPLYGITSPEPDISGFAENATLNGTTDGGTAPPTQLATKYSPFAPGATIAQALAGAGAMATAARSFLLPTAVSYGNVKSGAKATLSLASPFTSALSGRAKGLATATSKFNPFPQAILGRVGAAFSGLLSTVPRLNLMGTAKSQTVLKNNPTIGFGGIVGESPLEAYAVNYTRVRYWDWRAFLGAKVPKGGGGSGPAS